jgi:truncated hemoglobin YjbI
MKRLLPLFAQYAPDAAAGLRTQLTALASEPANKTVRDDHKLLDLGLREETTSEQLNKLQDRLDRAATSRERDAILAEVALALADQGDNRAQDLADRIDDSARRAQVREVVDIVFVRLAIRKKDAMEIARLARTGQLNHAQCAWAYTQAGRLLIDTKRQNALEFLEQAAAEARRVDGQNSDRASLLIGVARQFATADSVRALEIMGEVVKVANSAPDFNGEPTQLTFPLLTKRGMSITSIGGEEFGLAGVLRLLSKQDLHQSLSLAKSFTNEAAKAAAILAVARSALEN